MRKFIVVAVVLACVAGCGDGRFKPGEEVLLVSQNPKYDVVAVTPPSAIAATLVPSGSKARIARDEASKDATAPAVSGRYVEVIVLDPPHAGLAGKVPAFDIKRP
jgi:hypothetical protein